METLQLEIRDQQRATWDRFSPGWKKWDAFTMRLLQPMGEAIIAALRLQPTDAVLDIATGTGEPGLTIAAQVPQGRVVAQDLSEGMLRVAREHAQARGLTNFETTLGDACELPFVDGTFDALSCRMGFMFFPDMALAAREMARVLKPGGRMATSVWSGSEHNSWITGLIGIIKRHLDLPAPPPGAPGMFRCAQPRFISDLLRETGFVDVGEREVRGQVRYVSPDEYWSFQTEVVAPVVSALSGADDATKARIQAEAYELARQTSPGGGPVTFDFGSWVVWGTKG